MLSEIVPFVFGFNRGKRKEVSGLVLYFFETCPYCIKVRLAMKRLGIRLEERNIKRNPQYRDELIKGGGKKTVPCLRIQEDRGDFWLYESDQIIEYLKSQVSSVSV